MKNKQEPSNPKEAEPLENHEDGKQSLPAAPKRLWYEKTVEYLFLREAFFQEREASARPLAGLTERAADLVFRAGAKHVLIEFKREVDDISSENKKFACESRELARSEMSKAAPAPWKQGRPEPHYLVYGELEEKSLALRACRYFDSTKAVEVKSVLQGGIPENEFVEYLAALLAVKKQDERSSGAVGPEGILQVVEVESGLHELVDYATLEEFCGEYPALQVLLEQVRPLAPADGGAEPPPGMRMRLGG